MSENVESVLERTLPVLKQARKLKLLTDQELRVIVRKRRDHEYAVSQPSVRRKNFLQYAVFEKDLSALMRTRMIRQRPKLTLNKGKRKIRDHIDRKKQIREMRAVVGKISSRVNHIYSRALNKFPGDSKLWIHYASYCIDSNMLTTASRVFMDAIAVCGGEENVWLSAMTYHFDKLGDARTARAVAQRALRMLPSSVNLWLEYFRMELYYLARLTTRRFALGLYPDGQDADINIDVEHFSELGSPDADKGTDISRLQNGEEVNEEVPPGKQRNFDNLTFWDGGASLAVLKGACNRMTLNDFNCAQFYIIAVECRLVPAKLLSAMVSLFEVKFPNSAATLFLSKRVEWDVMKAQWDRKVAKVKSESDQSDVQVSNIPATRTVELSDSANKLLSEIVNTFTNDKNGTKLDDLTNSTNEALKYLLRNMEEMMEDFNETINFSLFDKLRVLVGERNSNLLLTNNEEPNNWDVAALRQYLERGYDDLDISSACLFDCVKRICLQPFRSDDADRALCLYLKKDLETSQLDEIYESLISLAPITMSSLVSLAEALIQDLDNAQLKKMEISDGRRLQIRKLLSMASCLPNASQNVPYWRLYLDFERQVARDVKRAKEVYANAMRTLNTRYHATFVELQTLATLQSSR